MTARYAETAFSALSDIIESGRKLGIQVKTTDGPKRVCFVVQGNRRDARIESEQSLEGRATQRTHAICKGLCDVARVVREQARQARLRDGLKS